MFSQRWSPLLVVYGRVVSLTYTQMTKMDSGSCITDLRVHTYSHTYMQVHIHVYTNILNKQKEAVNVRVGKHEEVKGVCLGQAGRRREEEQCCNLRSTKNTQIAVPSLLFSSISSVLYNMSFGFHHRAPKGSLGDCKALQIIHQYALVSIHLFGDTDLSL